jgi:aldose 1-epimerase
MAIEQEGYIAAVNTPEWSVDQICESTASSLTYSVLILKYDADSPERPFEWSSTYKFSTIG